MRERESVQTVLSTELSFNGSIKDYCHKNCIVYRTNKKNYKPFFNHFVNRKIKIINSIIHLNIVMVHAFLCRLNYDIPQERDII